jgi:hypothetical protein
MLDLFPSLFLWGMIPLVIDFTLVCEGSFQNGMKCVYYETKPIQK